ncbi:MAG: DNA repair and recombination protein RadB [Candidatus Methanofastidiosia archaeon]
MRCRSFDELGDGIPEEFVTQVFGEFATGKTTLCLQLCVSASRQKKQSIFCDTENGFSPKRLLQMGGEEVLKNVMVLKPRKFKEQTQAVERIEKMMSEKIGFVCVDSMVSLYRLEAKDYESRRELSIELGKQLLILSRISKEYKIPVVITNQVYEKLDSKDVSPVGGAVLTYWSKLILKLEKLEGLGKRRAIVIRHPYVSEGESCEFKIAREGIVEISKSKAF